MELSGAFITCSADASSNLDVDRGNQKYQGTKDT
jgi:hypothetical protein